MSLLSAIVVLGIIGSVWTFIIIKARAAGRQKEKDGDPD